MSRPETGKTLLALDAGVRETGWALFLSEELEDTGIVTIPGRRGIEAATRINHLIQCLDTLVEQWSPAEVVYSQPSGIRWSVPSLELLETSLADWSRRNVLGLQAYTAQEVRSAIAGNAHASRDQLGYAVMTRFKMIGQCKSTHEWEAIAVGHYHLALTK